MLWLPTNNAPFALPRAMMSLGWNAPRRWTGTSVYYLQFIRGHMRADTARAERFLKRYERALPHLSEEMRRLVESQIGRSDIGFTIPSGRQDASPYWHAICTARLVGQNISSSFMKTLSVRAAQSDSFEELLRSISLEPSGHRSDIKSATKVLVVDDVLHTGRSVAACITHLRKAGHSTDAEVNVAVVLRTVGHVRG